MVVGYVAAAGQQQNPQDTTTQPQQGQPAWNSTPGKTTIPELLSLYYKANGYGDIGDSQAALGGNAQGIPAAELDTLIPGLGAQNTAQPPDVLNSALAAANSNRENMLKQTVAAAQASGSKTPLHDVYNSLYNQAQGFQQQQAQDKATAKGNSILSSADPATLKNLGITAAGAGGGKGKAASTSAASAQDLQQAGIQNWWNQTVAPYMQQQQALQQFHADAFDRMAYQTLASSPGSMTDLMKSYLPLISQAYHQQADNWQSNYINGQGNGTLIGNLLGDSKRNASVLNFLKSNATPINSSGSSGTDFVANLLAGK